MTNRFSPSVKFPWALDLNPTSYFWIPAQGLKLAQAGRKRVGRAKWATASLLGTFLLNFCCYFHRDFGVWVDNFWGKTLQKCFKHAAFSTFASTNPRYKYPSPLLFRVWQLRWSYCSKAPGNPHHNPFSPQRKALNLIVTPFAAGADARFAVSWVGANLFTEDKPLLRDPSLVTTLT